MLPPPPNAAPAHFFQPEPPPRRMVVHTPEALLAALHNALARGSLRDVQMCVERGASLEWRDEVEGQGMTALHLAVSSNAPPESKQQVLEWLVAQKVTLDAADYTEATALHCAAALGDALSCALLLRAGASPRARDAEGLSALHLAANGGHLRACEALTRNWAPVDVADFDEGEGDVGADAKDAKDASTKPRHSARVAALGASLYIARRGTPLHVCAAAARLACARHLVSAGADGNSRAGAQCSTPLHVAAREGHLALAELFLDAGAAADARDEFGETPLMRAAELGSLAMVSLLLSRGASAAAESAKGLTALHVAAARGHHCLFGPLVSAGAVVDARDALRYEDDDGGRTPLMHAAHYGSLPAFTRLVELGADRRLLSGAGWPALFYAVENSAPLPGRGDEANRHLALVRHILALDAADGVWATAARGRTALMVAAMQDAAEAVHVLAQTQPWSVAWADEGGRTAAHWAAVRGATAALEALLVRGANPLAKDAQGATPGQLLPPVNREPVRRKWEAEREGAAGERRWDYSAVVEATAFRYMKKSCAATRVRDVANERQCSSCKCYSFDALRCGACQSVFYCGSECQRKDWVAGGHRLLCRRVSGV